MHGGLRYLEHRDFALVRESLRERELPVPAGPHLVKPVRLLMPSTPTTGARRGSSAWAWCSTTPCRSTRRPGDTRSSTAAGVTARFTGIGQDGLTGSAVFTDGQVEDAERLCVELAVGRRDGAVIRTKARVEEPLHGADGRVSRGPVPRPPPGGDGELHDVQATVVLNVAGPWIDRIFRRGAPASPGSTAAPRAAT